MNSLVDSLPHASLQRVQVLPLHRLYGRTAVNVSPPMPSMIRCLNIICKVLNIPYATVDIVPVGISKTYKSMSQENTLDVQTLPVFLQQWTKKILNPVDKDCK